MKFRRNPIDEFKLSPKEHSKKKEAELQQASSLLDNAKKSAKLANLEKSYGGLLLEIAKLKGGLPK